MSLTKLQSEMLKHPVKFVKGADIASGATVNLANATGNFLDITGNTGPITSLGTVDAGVWFRLRFTSTPVLEYDATSMILAGGDDIEVQPGDIFDFVSLGSGNWVMGPYSLASGGTVSGGSFADALVQVNEEQTSGTNGGTFTTGARRVRTLNTVKTNLISGVALASNQLTGVPAGRYYAEFWATAVAVERHKAFLRDVTGAADLIVGSSEFASDSNVACTPSRGSQQFTLSVESTLQLEHSCENTEANRGFGLATSLGVEVYSSLSLWKIG